MSGNPPITTYCNHAESVEIISSPCVISFRDLFEILFQVHDSTVPDRQRNDVGHSYRSAIIYPNDEQKQAALDTIKKCRASDDWI